MGSLSAFHKPKQAPIFPRGNISQKSQAVIKVLGTAQDGGIPQIGCYCKNCQKARQDAQFIRLRPSLAILDPNAKKMFIIDASPDISLQYDSIHNRLKRAESRKKNTPDGILLTHAHIGHYTGLMFYGYEALSSDKLPVYCSRRMADFLTKNAPWSQLVKFQNISIHLIDPDTRISLTPEISVIPFLVPHRDEYSDTLGFQIAGQKKKLLYIPDIQGWKVWSRDIREEVESVDFALLDGTFYSPDELPGRDLSRIGHPFITTSIETLRQIAKKGKTRIYFTHLNHSNLALDPEGDALRHIVNEGFGVAQEGMELSL
jgi:pyrroloquinoline quinone biosynthesis protein B